MCAEDILSEVFDLNPTERREAIDRACGEDKNLRERVLHLLKLSESDRVKFLENDPLPHQVSRFSPGDMIGTYQLTRLLGVGGSGYVFEAQQKSPQRSVAIKLLRWGEVSKNLGDRFRTESELLGRLTHQGIATIIESGVEHIDDNWSQPYIVMEYVEGIPLHCYVKDTRPTFNNALRILIKICDAVQYAHQHGVIHGDLNPSNILVDSNGTPKVIDFGIGRLVEDLDHRTINTAYIEGTPRFMSPERLAGTSNYASVQSDVYALGVLHHYILAGIFPPDDGSIDPQNWLAKNGSTHNVSISRRDRTVDLGTMIKKAVTPDPAKRYDSIARFSDDLQNLLSMHLVSTQQRTTISIGRLFARRNPLFASLLILACVLTVTAAGSVTWGFTHAVRSEREVRRALEDSTQIANTLREIIVGGRYDKQSGQVSIVDLLEHGERHVDSLDISSPEIKAHLYLTLAQAYDTIGEYDQCMACIQNGVAYLDQSDTDAHETRVELRLLLSSTHRRLGNPTEALRLNSALAEELARDGAPMELVFRCKNMIGLDLQQLGQYERSEEVLRNLLDQVIEIHGEEHPTSMLVCTNLALTLQHLGRAKEAIEYAKVIHEKSFAVWGAQDQRVIQTGNTLAWAYVSAERYDEAERVLLNLISHVKETHGNDSVFLPQTAHSLAFLYLRSEKYEAMQNVLEEYLDAAHHHFSAASWYRNEYESIYALSLIRNDQAVEAIPILKPACKTLETLLGTQHPTTQEAIKALIEAYRLTDDEDSARHWEEKISAIAP